MSTQKSMFEGIKEVKELRQKKKHNRLKKWHIRVYVMADQTNTTQHVQLNMTQPLTRRTQHSTVKCIFIYTKTVYNSSLTF